jgi:hypothetical protein
VGGDGVLQEASSCHLLLYYFLFITALTDHAGITGLRKQVMQLSPNVSHGVSERVAGYPHCDSSTQGVSRGNAVLKVLYFENTKLKKEGKRVLNYRTIYIVEYALAKPS